MLTDNQRDEMLIRIDERQEHIQDKLAEAFSEGPKGFVRHDIYDRDRSGNTWFKRIIGGVILGAIAKTLMDVFIR